MSNYPPSVDPNDPRAPWNEPEGECRYCGTPCEGDICRSCHEEEQADFDHEDKDYLK